MKKRIAVVCAGLMVVGIIFTFSCFKKSNTKPEFSMITRSAYVDKLQLEIEEWNNELDMLEFKVNNLTGEAKEKANEHLIVLKIQQNTLSTLLNKIENAEDNAWVKLKAGADSAKVKFNFSLAKAKLETN